MRESCHIDRLAPWRTTQTSTTNDDAMLMRAEERNEVEWEEGYPRRRSVVDELPLAVAVAFSRSL